jgi:magnesium-transporting ATPase (P-type)
VVPGDVVVIKPGTINCDIAIVKGNRIKVDESALTGESAPVAKEPLTYKVKSDIYCTVRHKANTIFAGTTVIEVDDRERVLGLVLSIGSFTTKGELLCEVLSYERHKMEADHEISTVIAILCIQAIVLLVLVFIFLNEQWIFAWFYGKFLRHNYDLHIAVFSLIITLQVFS